MAGFAGGGVGDECNAMAYMADPVEPVGRAMRMRVCRRNCPAVLVAVRQRVSNRESELRLDRSAGPPGQGTQGS